MKRIVITDSTPIPPFGEPARDLRILNKPLWLLQRDLLVGYCRGPDTVESLDEIQDTQGELLVHRDNLFFNQRLIDTFIASARASGQACQIAFSRTDKAITTHALPLQEGIRLHASGDVYVGELYYFPNGYTDDVQPLLIDTRPREMGYYHIPSYMAPNQGDLVFQVPLLTFLSIEHWVHIFLANSPFGVFAYGRAHEQLVEDSWKEKLAVSLTTFWDRVNPVGPRWRNNMFSSSRLVKIGKDCSIDPTAIIHGPTIIGNNVTIGAGAVITNSLIGNNVNIMQGCQVMLSVVSDRCYLPFNASLFMSTLMENSMVAQLSCLQMCVVGRDTFIGAGNIFTDFNLTNRPIRTFYKDELHDVGLPVIGSAVGHSCKIGSGFVVYPGRMIGSNTTLVCAEPAAVVSRNVHVEAEENEPDYFGDGPRKVYLWPHPYDPAARLSSEHGEESPQSMDLSPLPRKDAAAHDASIESFELSLPTATRHRRTSR